MRIELTALAWEARVLPLYDARSAHLGRHERAFYAYPATHSIPGR